VITDFKPPYFLAPLAGVTSFSFRKIAVEFGCPFSFTEMVSAKAITMRNKKTDALISEVPNAKNGLQLFGHEPGIFSEAIKIVSENHDFDLIDINMGCPAPKIVRTGEGAALLKDLKLSEKIVASAAKSTSVPISVKMRMGYESDSNIMSEGFARFEEAGAKMLTIHPRTREQFFKGVPDYEAALLAKEKSGIKIPLVINGDIDTIKKAEELMRDFDGLMIGRKAAEAPWFFEELINGEELHFDFEQKSAVFLKFLNYLNEEKGERTAVSEIRKFTGWFFKGEQGVKELKNRINLAKSVAEIECTVLE
jgi:tRNA-dihydrouridine synthase B